MNQIFDVVIIGGGLAGLTSAFQLARLGKKVVLLEKEKYPFHKVCGEYIAMESWAFLESCGVPLRTLDLPKINKLKISAPNGRYIEHTLNPGGFGISRYTLDQILFEIVKKEGVLVLDNTKANNIEFDNNQFTITTDNRTFFSKLVIGSYGKRSNIDVKLSRKFIAKPQPPQRNYLGVKYHINIKLPSDVIEMHNFDDGYCGISKVDGNKYCLCYLTTAKNLQKYGTIKEMEQRVLMTNPFLKKYLTEAEFLYDTPLSISQINFADKSTVEQHILMCGDSAGMITPLCGNGMSMALHGSKILAQIANRFLEEEITRDELEMQYSNVWKNNFEARIIVGRLIQYSFGKEVLTNMAIGALKPFPKVVDKLISLTHGNEF